MEHTNSRRASGLLAALCCAIALFAPLGGSAHGEQAVSQSRYSAGLLAAINAYRIKNGVAPLQRSDNLDVLAYGHSQQMASAGQLSHDGFRERAMRSNSPVCAENVGWNHATPDAQLRAWIESPAHNRNLLDPRVAQAGVGDASAYVTFLACG